MGEGREGRGKPSGGAEESHPFSTGFLKRRKTHFSLLPANDGGG